MKLLVIVSSLDLRQPFSATPAWWQLLRGLYEIGVEVITTPYQGPAIESLWWRAEPNPAQLQGDAFQSLRGLARRLLPEAAPGAEAPVRGESTGDRAIRQLVQATITPLWRRHVRRILRREGDVDAVLVLTVPLNHLRGVPRGISENFDIPVLYYDGDVPASLPGMRGFASGFRIYQGADMSEYSAFISNSSGGEALLREMGAKQTHTLWYGADPDVFSPLPQRTQDIDCFFYGHGREYRAQWIQWMISEPTRAMPGSSFAVRGHNLGALGGVQSLPYLSLSKLREYVSRSKLNLCITRAAHANLYGSSSSRPFELAAMQACIVSNPYLGIEEWFEPEKEIVLVHSAEEALERYRYLLSHDSERRSIAEAARARVLKQHSYRQRAQSLRTILEQYI